MSDKLTWFKFHPANWVMGKIQRCDEVSQARFIRLCCLYWNKEGVVSLEDAEIELESEVLNELLKKKVIKCTDRFISIDFLDEQLSEISKKTNRESESGKLGNLKRWHPHLYDQVKKDQLSISDAFRIAKQSPPDQPPKGMQSELIADKNRSDKEQKRIEKMEDTNSIPSINEFEEYALDQAEKLNLSIDMAKLKAKYQSWKEDGWRTGHGRKIKNWKSTLLNTLNYLQKEKNSAKKEEKSFDQKQYVA